MSPKNVDESLLFMITVEMEYQEYIGKESNYRLVRHNLTDICDLQRAFRGRIYK